MRAFTGNRRGSRLTALLSPARNAAIALLFVVSLLATGESASATVSPDLTGESEWQGQLVETPTPAGFGSGVWNLTEVRWTDPGGNSIVNGFEQSASNPQYWISYTEHGTIANGTFTYVGSAHDQNLPFGVVACDVKGAESISTNSITFSAQASGSGACSSESGTANLTNVTGMVGANCTSCQCKKIFNMPVNGLPGNGDQQCQSGPTKAGDPIDIGTGNVLDAVTDYETAGPNRLTFDRYYNSKKPVATFANGMGKQWRHSYDRYLNVAPFLPGFLQSVIVAERPDGTQLLLYAGGGGYAAGPGDDTSLTVSGGIYSLKLHDDSVETYTNTGQLTAIKYRGGYTLTMAYNGSGQLATVTDSYGRQLVFTYTGGLLTQVTTPDSLVVTYAYGSSGVNPGVNDRLASVSYNTSPATSQTYNYTNTSFPFALTSVTDENGNAASSWTYDVYGRGLTSQHGSGAGLTTVTYNDSTDGSGTVTNELGNQETYSFHYFLGQLPVAKITRATGGTTYVLTYDSHNYIASIKDWDGHLTTFVNNLHGDPTTIVEASGTTTARTTTIAYDTTWVHQPASVVTPGLTTTYTYDTNGSPLTITGTDTTTTSVPYSTNGQARTWTFTWSNFLPATITPPKGSSFATSLTFDTSGALTQTADALGHATNVTSRTGGGRPLTVTDANGVTATLAYNARNWLSSETLATAGGNLTTSFTYDAAGNLTQTTQPDGSFITATYDAANRLTKIADSFSNSVNYTLDAAGNATATAVKDPTNVTKLSLSATFDALRRTTKDTNGTNWNTTYAYNNNGAVGQYVPPSQANNDTVDALNRRLTENLYPYGNITYTWDAHDRPLTITARNNAVTSYVYDGFGELIQKTSPDSGTMVYHFDANGNLTQKVDALAVIANYTYDATDRLLTVSYPAAPSENVTYTYDQTGTGFAFGVGRITTVADMAGTLTRTYDERGNLLTEKRVNGGTTLLTTYGYDSASRLTSITYPSGFVAAYVRDAMGKVTSVTGKPSGAGSPTTLASGITYEPLGPWLGFTYGNGIVETVTRDGNYDLLTLKDQGTATVQNISYQLNVTQDQPTYFTDSLTTSNNLSIAYDGLYRLQNFNTTAGAYGQTFDNNGNRATYTYPASNSYTYTANTNRLATIVTGGVTTTVSTDARGNITGFSPGYGASAVTTLSYNNTGRLTSVASASGTLGAYVYDAFGNRYSKTVGANTTLFSYAPGMTLLEETTAGTATDYVYLNDRPIATVTGSTFTYLHGDKLGTPRVMTNASQTVLGTASYVPFGEVKATTGSFTVKLRMPGQYFDAETGFSHNGFRDYVPALGRYLETDPLGLHGGSQHSGLNTYLYVGARPFTLTDTRGLIDDQFINPSDIIQSQLQQLANDKARLFDSMGDSGFSGPQLKAMDKYPGLRPAYRGGNIDRMVRDAVQDDSRVCHLRGHSNRGVDFTDDETGIRYEMTTEAQWPTKIAKYGADNLRFINTGLLSDLASGLQVLDAGITFYSAYQLGVDPLKYMLSRSSPNYLLDQFFRNPGDQVTY